MNEVMPVSAVDRKTRFLETLEREAKRTRRVLEAFPPGGEDFKPHPTSGAAREVAWVIALGESLMIKALTTGFDWSKPSAPQPKAPATFAEIAEAIDRNRARVAETLAGVDDALLDETVKFPVGPGKIGDYRKIDFLQHFLFDHIHHRGQLSVYLRMTGGKVPSIYGPSGDEPWF